MLGLADTATLQEVQKHLPGYLREWMNDFLNTHEL